MPAGRCLSRGSARNTSLRGHTHGRSGGVQRAFNRTRAPQQQSERVGQQTLLRLMRRLARKPAVLQRRRLLCSQPPQLVDPPSKTRVLLEDAIKGVLVAGVSASLVYGYRAHNRQQEMLERERAREEAIRALDPSDAIGFQAPPRPNGILGTVESGIVELRERTGESVYNSRAREH